MIAVGYGTGESRQKEELRVGQEAQEVETDPLLPTFGGHPPTHWEARGTASTFLIPGASLHLNGHDPASRTTPLFCFSI